MALYRPVDNDDTDLPFLFCFVWPGREEVGHVTATKAPLADPSLRALATRWQYLPRGNSLHSLFYFSKGICIIIYVYM